MLSSVSFFATSNLLKTGKVNSYPFMSNLAGKKLVLLGGTGSLGNAIAELITKDFCDLDRLVIFSRDEVKQLDMMSKFSEEEYPFIKYVIGDVRDRDRLIEIMEDADLVIHAAALKHVVMAERNPSECEKTNVAGTRNVINACLDWNTKRALLISTDKAVNPIGVYGKSKEAAEKLFLEANGDKTNFGVVRLGNIIGSRGSVWEVFREQAKTGVLKVTHPDATRFCISVDDAASFVVDQLLNVDSGNISHPEMDSFRVIDLAREIAPDCEIEIVGLRPGDKMHEELGGRSSEEFFGETEKAF